MCSYGITTDAATDNVRDPTYVDGITMQFAQKLGVNPGRRCGNNRSSGSDCCCNFIALGNYCGRTEEKRLEEAHRRMSNRVFNLGITAHGYQEPILEAINPNPKYRDPNIGKPQISSYLPSPVENVTIDYEKVAENFRSIDVYSGLVDGKHYGRFNRLRQHKIRHTRNPNGKIHAISGFWLFMSDHIRISGWILINGFCILNV